MKNRRELLKAIPFLVTIPFVRFPNGESQFKLSERPSLPKPDEGYTHVSRRCLMCDKEIFVIAPIEYLQKSGGDYGRAILCQKHKNQPTIEIHPYDACALFNSADADEAFLVNGSFIAFREKLYHQTVEVSPTFDPIKYYRDKEKFLFNESYEPMDR